jgi:uncharacterized protein YjbI with pentapeptide repeats
MTDAQPLQDRWPYETVLVRNTQEPDTDRQQELESLYLDNVEKDFPPYAGVRIDTLGELLWIMKERGWESITDPYGSADRAADFREADLARVDLSHVKLGRAQLCRATLTRSNLSGAVLPMANLDRARLQEANLSGADLRSATLHSMEAVHLWAVEARMERCDMRGAVLNEARLSNAHLDDSDLREITLTGATLLGASLKLVRLDQQSSIDEAVFDEHTRFLDILWGGTTLSRNNWNDLRKLGDEDDVPAHGERKDIAQAYRRVARTYRILSLNLRQQGMAEPADRFRMRGISWQARSDFRLRRYGRWASTMTLRGIGGYGQTLWVPLLYYVLVVLSWTGFYLVISCHPTAEQSHLGLWDSLVYSITAFHGRGVYPSGITVGRLMTLLGALEAVIGLFIEAILVASFARRFMGD